MLSLRDPPTTDRLLDALPQGVYLTDGDGTLRDANGALLSILGLDSLDAVRGRRVDDFIVDPEQALARWNRLRHNGRSEALYLDIRTAAGQPRTVLDSCHAVAPPNTPDTRYVGFMLDVSDRPEAIAESRRLVAQMQEGVLIADNEHHIQAVNNRFCEMVGYGRDQLVGENSFELIFRDAATQSVLQQQIQRRRAGLSDQYEIQAVTRSKTPIWFLVGANPVCDHDGNVVGWMGIHTDITARKRVEAELAQLKAFFEHVLSVVPAQLAVLRADGRYLFVNAAFASDADLRSWLVGRTDRDYVARLGLHPSVAERREGELREAVHHKTMRQFEEMLEDPNGDTRHYVRCLNPSVTGAGEVTHVVSSAVDVTALKQAQEERRRLEQRLQEGQKLESLGQMAGGIAHDFNNLLVGIMGHAELALAEPPTDTPINEHLRHIEQAAHRGAELTNQMLAYSGKGTIIVQPLSVTTLVQDMKKLLESSTTRTARLDYLLAPNVPLIKADATQIRQVVLNLVTNASEAVGQDEGLITLRTGALDADRRYLSTTLPDGDLPAGRYAFIEVIDNGCGMDRQTKPKVFDPFFSTKFTGRGLGLAVVLGIVRGHGGAIKLTSRLDHGTAVRVLFPAVDDVEAVQSNGEGEGEGEGDHVIAWQGHGTVLVVDDDATVRNVAQRMLQRFGFEVVTAADGVEALAAYEKAPDAFALVLLDLTMPRLDGGATARRILQLNPRARIVLMSGYTGEELSTQFAGTGFSAFLQKPFRLGVVQQLLREVLEGGGDAG